MQDIKAEFPGGGCVKILQIREICGLEGLLSLERLDLSSNRIKRIGKRSH